MAVVCPNCGSADTQTLVDKNQCLSCGALITQDGQVATAGADQTTKDMIAKAIAPREVNVVGNFADLQRAGAVGAFDDSNAKADVGSQTEANEATNAQAVEQAQAAATDQLDAAQAAINEQKSALDASSTTNSSNDANG